MNTIIEKLKAEIERRMRICERVRGEGGENQDYYHGKAVSYNETLTFLSDLEKECEEKPNSQWSEEDKRALNDVIVALSMYANGEIPYILPSQLLEDVERLKSFHLKEKLEKPTTAEGLEEEIYNYANTIAEGTPLFEIIPQTARHFAQWQKEQMLKEAVEGRVVDAGIFTTYNTPVEYTHSGDKVKFIIVKED